MGFFKELAKGAMNSLNEYNAEMKALKLRMEAKSTEELMKIVKSEGFFGSSEKDKKMAYLVLRQRGAI